MRAILSRALSLLVVAIYLAIGTTATGNIAADFRDLLGLSIFCLPMIWFPEALGNFTGYVGRGGNVDTQTPPALMAALGWIALLSLPLISHLLR